MQGVFLLPPMVVKAEIVGIRHAGILDMEGTQQIFASGDELNMQGVLSHLQVIGQVKDKGRTDGSYQ